ncbi:MAG: hypothetical protein EOO11_07125 [Chitinophagaceae bacterium]|nr:MAG: hypothetical protein EOO11_07125 [Chitinophagaceae bacterium]
MKFLLTLLLLPVAHAASAQYFYKDIIGTRETNEQMKRYLDNRVTAVTLVSYDAEGNKSEDFRVAQAFNNTDRQLSTSTQLGDAEPTTLLSWADEQGRVIRTVDSSSANVSTTTYSFTREGQLERMTSVSADSTGKFRQTEEHQWLYSNGKPTRMLRIKNGTDTTVVSFKLDDRGQVAEERSQRAGAAPDVVYYYYNDRGFLTDIVRFNERAKRLLPEYMFEYSDAGQVIQRITVPANNSNYSIWRYQYDSRGLKVREALFDRNKRLNGKVEYQYTTGS